jgi:hypothetical protein
LLEPSRSPARTSRPRTSSSRSAVTASCVEYHGLSLVAGETDARDADSRLLCVSGGLQNGCTAGARRHHHMRLRFECDRPCGNQASATLGRTLGRIPGHTRGESRGRGGRTPSVQRAPGRRRLGSTSVADRPRFRLRATGRRAAAARGVIHGEELSLFATFWGDWHSPSTGSAWYTDPP